MLKIEKGIPILTRGFNGGRKPIYPFSEMEIGDSFFSDRPKCSGGAWAYGKKHGIKFVARKVEGGIRIWRIA